MGKKRVSYRTLPDGIRARHTPPDEQNPGGRLEIVREGSPLRERILARRPLVKSMLSDIRENHRKRVDFKLALQRKGDVPPDKTPL